MLMLEHASAMIEKKLAKKLKVFLTLVATCVSES